MVKVIWICVAVLVFYCVPATSILLVIPEDVATGFAGIYGFTPRFLTGMDHRFGFGFRFGNHADFQVLYEVGPQVYTRPLQPVSRIRSASYRARVARRRPFVELLLRAGILQEATFETRDDLDCCDDEPR